MKTDELHLTVDELDELCRLYMDCKLSVLEEKELEYILCRTEFTSPTIAEVKALMNIQLLPRSYKATRKTKFWNWKFVSGIAASVTGILSVALYFSAPQKSNMLDNESSVYITAYSHGERLSGNEAVTATNIAMAKADSLMKNASLTEREYLLRANDIINGTLNN